MTLNDEFCNRKVLESLDIVNTYHIIIQSVSYVSRKISLISQYWRILHLLTLRVASSRVQKCEFDGPWFFMFYILLLKVSLLHTCMLYPNVAASKSERITKQYFVEGVKNECKTKNFMK